MLETSLLLGVVTLVGALADLAPANFQQSAANDKQAGDEIAKLRETLQQTGPEARGARESAVGALLLMKRTEAHAVLREALARGEDPDRLGRFIVDELAKRWAQPADQVFGDDKLRPALLRGYAETLIGWFAAEAPPRPEQIGPDLLAAASACLRTMRTSERKDTFVAVFDAADLPLKRAALRAAATCQDLGLAPWIAAALDVPELQAAASAALQELTFVAAPFTDKAAFDAWYAENQQTYLQLAVAAARRAEGAIREVRRAAAEQVRAIRIQLVRALTKSEAIDWAALQSEVLGDQPPGSTSAYLAELRDQLGANERPGGARRQDRRAFAEKLDARLDSLVRDPEAFAVTLETLAYLFARDDEEMRQKVVARLILGVRSESVQVVRASLRGFRRCYTPHNRKIVVDAARRALDNGDAMTLGDALQTLGARGWFAPAADEVDLDDWLALLTGVLARPDLPGDVKSRAADAAVMTDREEKLSPRAFGLLAGVVHDAAQPVVMRKQALILLGKFTLDEARAGEFVRQLCGLLEDPEAGLREQAARDLQRLPVGSKEEVARWAGEVAVKAAQRFGVETSDAVLAELVRCVRSVYEADPNNNVIGQLLAHVPRLVNASPDGPDGMRRRRLVEALAAIGSSQAVPAEHWIKVGGALVELRARAALLDVLQRQGAAGWAAQARDRGDENAAAGLRLILAAARLKPAEPSWRDLREEAGRVADAFDVLEAAGAAPDDAPSRALRVLALAAVGNHARVRELGQRFLTATDQPLSADQGAEVALAVADAEIAGGDLAGAATRVAALPGSERVLTFIERLAGLLVGENGHEAAAPLADRLVRETTVAAPAFARRLLLQAEVRAAADGADVEAILADLKKHESRFRAEVASAELWRRYQELVTRLDQRRG